MRLQREWIERLIFRGEAARRFLQESPVLPDVWLEFGERYSSATPSGRLFVWVDLLLEPHHDATAGRLHRALRRRIAAEYGREPDGKLSGADEAWWNELRVQEHKAFSSAEIPPHDLAYTQSTVVARFTLRELVRIVLPLSSWWDVHVCKKPSMGTRSLATKAPGARSRLSEALNQLRVKGTRSQKAPGELLWLIRLVGSIIVAADLPEPPRPEDARKQFDEVCRDDAGLVAAFADLLGSPLPDEAMAPSLLFLVSRNREARPTISYSTLAVKADAARRLFDVSCRSLTWAIVDSGVDAEHPAFRLLSAPEVPYLTPWEKAPAAAAGAAKTAKGAQVAQAAKAAQPALNRTRVLATYDFTRVRYLLSCTHDDAEWRLKKERANRPPKDSPEFPAWEREVKFWSDLTHLDTAKQVALDRVREAVVEGLAIDWELLEPLLRISDGADYVRPTHSHGTHVAGILAADWKRAYWPRKPGLQPQDDLVGVAPDLRIYDLRILDENGEGDEFAVIAALQFIRHLNAHREFLIHGVNLSLSIRHDVANFACGRTPICQESERLVASGIVVVAAAGNEGYGSFGTSSLAGTPERRLDGYRSISISDPGNAEGVITVGATHRQKPHTYGVSYFSSRGPTGDGRQKPDLVAPGEKITAPVPGDGDDVKDGTSMAAPHVSGAAALLMARHSELIGQPERIKKILCATATDLGRERYFQGAGMLDILRALQSV